MKLETRKIGTIGFEPTVLSLGCWAFGGAQWGGQEDEDSISAIHAALDLGITHFDTAQGYGAGRSERLCGQELKGVRDRVLLATKTAAGSAQAMLDAVDVSLKRLQTDTIDLFYIHWPQKGLDLADTMAGLEQAREAGKIRGVGVSNFSVEQMERAMTAGTIDAHQLCYNLLWRWDERGVIPFCIKHHIGVVTYSSIAQGILTGKFPREPHFREDDLRPQTVHFDPAVWPHVYDTVEEMKDVARDSGRSLTHLAIRWVAAQQGITSVLVGARNAEQVRRNLGAMESEISDSDLSRLSEISDRAISHIPDTGNIFRYYP